MCCVQENVYNVYTMYYVQKTVCTMCNCVYYVLCTRSCVHYVYYTCDEQEMCTLHAYYMLCANTCVYYLYTMCHVQENVNTICIYMHSLHARKRVLLCVMWKNQKCDGRIFLRITYKLIRYKVTIGFLIKI